MTQFCPISLSNVIDKIVLKVLAKRHKKSSIPDYFRKSKCLGSSYGIVRLIIANILLAFESCIIWSYKHKRTRNTFMVVKLDMNIFYDRVEWVLPRAIIKKGFMLILLIWFWSANLVLFILSSYLFLLPRITHLLLLPFLLF